MNLRNECLDCMRLQLGKLLETHQISAEIGQATREEFEKYVQSYDTSKVTPPEVASYLYTLVAKLIGIEDPFYHEKQISTQFAKELCAIFEKKLEHSKDKFQDIVKIVMSGNIIDYGADKDFTIEKAEKHLSQALEVELDENKIKEFKNLLDNAKSIFYILDNCGEAVFDRLLIDLYQDKITLGVRGRPILNDVTPNELAISNLDHLRYVDTEDNTPGVSLRKSGKEFLHHLYNSDLVIAKGQGNFESLESLDIPICHLLCVKCDVISTLTNTQKFSPLIQIRT